MRAIEYDRYGGPEKLHAADVPRPTAGPGRMLVEVVATSVNLSDWESLRGSPAYARFGGLRRPSRRVLGSDIAGRVAALGSGVEGSRSVTRCTATTSSSGVDSRSSRSCRAAFAHKPAELTFAQAAAIPQAGAIAQHGTAGIEPGQRVLINGAGGGGGSFAIQLAKLAGAHVTGVDNAGKLDFMRALGADEVIDYRATDPTRSGQYDLVLDMVAYRSVFSYRRMLAPGGRYRLVGGTARSLLRVLTIGSLVGRLTGRRIGVLAVGLGPNGFRPVAERCVKGEVDIHIDSTFTLDEVPDALRRVGDGLAKGKVVVEL